MDSNSIEEQDQPVGPGVNVFQGIDVQRIRNYFSPDHVAYLNPDEFHAIRLDVLELLEHVESDCLLARVETARREMAENDILPSEY